MEHMVVLQSDKKYMGKITRMQILYQVMQWKPHSGILINDKIILTQSAKHGSKDFHLPKSHCKLKPGAIEINRA